MTTTENEIKMQKLLVDLEEKSMEEIENLLQGVADKAETEIFESEAVGILDCVIQVDESYDKNEILIKAIRQECKRNSGKKYLWTTPLGYVELDDLYLRGVLCTLMRIDHNIIHGIGKGEDENELQIILNTKNLLVMDGARYKRMVEFFNSSELKDTIPGHIENSIVSLFNANVVIIKDEGADFFPHVLIPIEMGSDLEYISCGDRMSKYLLHRITVTKDSSTFETTEEFMNDFEKFQNKLLDFKNPITCNYRGPTFNARLDNDGIKCAIQSRPGMGDFMESYLGKLKKHGFRNKLDCVKKYHFNERLVALCQTNLTPDSFDVISRDMTTAMMVMAGMARFTSNFDGVMVTSENGVALLNLESTFLLLALNHGVCYHPETMQIMNEIPVKVKDEFRTLTNMSIFKETFQGLSSLMKILGDEFLITSISVYDRVLSKESFYNPFRNFKRMMKSKCAGDFMFLVEDKGFKKGVIEVEKVSMVEVVGEHFNEMLSAGLAS